MSTETMETALKAEPVYFCESWLLPQLVNWFGTWRVMGTARETVVYNCDTELKRVLYMLSRVSRSLLVKKQIANPDYARFTPLILLGLKNSQGFSYTSWRSLPDLHWILEPDLLSAVNHPAQVVADVYGLGSERLLQIRNQGLTTKTGKTAGLVKNAETTWSLNGIQDTEIGSLPKLAQSILCQIWLAHPKNRRMNMILDFRNWDNMPEPLVSQELFVPDPQPEKVKPKDNMLPWDIE